MESDLKGKKVFVRVDLNVPLDDNFNITDDTRIRAAVPSIKYLMGHGAKVILSSHLGCPKGVTPKYSLKPLVPRLSELLGVEVKMANDCIGAEKLVAEIPGGGVLLLENVRFYNEEEKNDPEFAKKLASLADLYGNDAFGTAHRAHASTERVAKYSKPSVAGFLMEKLQNIHQGYSTDTSVRFLNAREGNVTKAQKMLVDFLKRRVKKDTEKSVKVVESRRVAAALVEASLLDEHQAAGLIHRVLGVKPLEEAFVVSENPTQGKRRRGEESSQPERSSLDDNLEGAQAQLLMIFFSDKDLLGKPPRKCDMVITLKFGNRRVNCILVDSGSSCNIMY